MPEVKSAEMTFGRVYHDSAVYAKAMVPLILMVFLINTVPLVYADLNWSEADGTRFAGLIGLVNLLFQLLVVKRILQFDDRFTGSNQSFVPRLFALQIVYFLAIAVGIVCLIVPGIYIGFRWYLAVPALIAGGNSISGSFKESWTLTEGKFLDFLIISLPIIVLYTVGIFCVFFLWDIVEPIISMTVAESLASLALIATWIIFAAIYIRLTTLAREKT
ncbi:glycerophosphoryl diester phosphodiesterase membrane domain-containing protein [Parasphingorhabdus sp.]|uniref:glycerophosphoryl diester phosphodiesterase membrane domain-containing protein n=1 Tax=Parasphingorhabdus sp. TaxID=2709688 RepID=UPI003A94872C